MKTEVAEKRASLDKVTKSAKKAAAPMVSALLLALAFFATRSLNQSEISTIWFLVGVTGPMSFAFPIVVFKTDFLKAVLRKSPDWIVESLWGTYMTVCGIAFLFFAFAMVWSNLRDLFTVIDTIFILLLSAFSFGMAIRAVIRRRGREDAKLAKKEMGAILDSSMKRTAYGGAILIAVFVLPVCALLFQPLTASSLQGSVISVSLAPLLVWAVLRFLVYQMYFIHTDQLEMLAERVDADGPQRFDKNVLDFANITRYGRLNKRHIKQSRHSRSRGKKP